MALIRFIMDPVHSSSFSQFKNKILPTEISFLLLIEKWLDFNIGNTISNKGYSMQLKKIDNKRPFS